jgi:nitroimidazol reductase NimA-like FMN-containing flavoprotein (pyridoxamine 5'-phosphate oxidase superfamily)
MRYKPIQYEGSDKMRRTEREVTDRTELFDILMHGNVCHLALVDRDSPYVVALNYGFLWETGDFPVLYFHCAKAGKKLDIIKNNNSGCFIIDIAHELVQGKTDSDCTMKYESVVGRGSIEIVENKDEKKRALDALMGHYTGRSSFSYDERVFDMTAVLKIAVTSLSGKKNL